MTPGSNGHLQWILVAFGLFFICLVVHAGTIAVQDDTVVVEALTSSSNVTTSQGKVKRTCACDETVETPMCASNGVTYKSTCRFECAKARVTRLRIVKNGPCSQTSNRGSYWQGRRS